MARRFKPQESAADQALQAEIPKHIGESNRPEMDIGEMGQSEGHGEGVGFR